MEVYHLDNIFKLNAEAFKFGIAQSSLSVELNICAGDVGEFLLDQCCRGL